MLATTAATAGGAAARAGAGAAGAATIPPLAAASRRRLPLLLRRRAPALAAATADNGSPHPRSTATEPLSPLSSISGSGSLTSSMQDDDGGSSPIDDDRGLTPGQALTEWLERNGAPQDKLELCPFPDNSAYFPSASSPAPPPLSSSSPPPFSSLRDRPAADVAVARVALKPGDVALSVPERLVLTLGRIVGSDDLADKLTSGKLSELSVLSLVLAYEKKSGRKSRWRPFIRELDRQRARSGAAGGAESPLLWAEGEAARLLKGSPVVGQVEARLQGIRDEYDQLDTVWFMASTLFGRYPFDMPSECLPFPIFLSAFAAVQAATVHLQGVPPARRFALVPLGPPLLSYSSSCRAMLAYNPSNECVELAVDRPYQPGQPVLAWCGPQPNSRLLLNYGFVDLGNPHDKMTVVATLDARDPLFKLKRQALAAAPGAGTMASFDLRPPPAEGSAGAGAGTGAGAGAHGHGGAAAAAAAGGGAPPSAAAAPPPPLPPTLLPWLRLACATTEAQVKACRVFGPKEAAEAAAAEAEARRADPALHGAAASLLARELQARLDGYGRPLWRDLEILAEEGDAVSDPRERVAARLTKLERGILMAALEAVVGGGGEAAAATGATATAAVPFPPTFKW